MTSPLQTTMFNGVSDFYNGVATQSLRFDDGSSSFLTRTFVTPTNQNRWTLNVWVKRGALGARRVIIGMPYVNSAECFFGFDDDDKIEWQQYSVGGLTQVNDLTTTQVFRDTSSWYNCHLIFDSAGSGDDRQQIWVNGVKITSYSTESRSAEDSVWNINSRVHYFGNRNSGNYFDGYMSEINFVDGLALDPTYFGETKNGIWIAKNPVVSNYGNNGFRLQFKNTGTGTTSQGTTATTNIGDDSSGSGHNFAVSGLSAHDSNMPDSPENNFATMNSLINGYGTNITMSEGNLAGTGTSSQYNNTLGTILMTSGKWYWEISSANFNNYDMLGIAIETALQTGDSTPYGQTGVVAYATHGASYVESNSGSSAGTYTDFLDSEIIGVAVDLDASPRTVKFYNNNSLQFTENLSSNFDDIGILPFFCIGTADTIKVNFGQDSSFAGLKTAQGNTDANGIGDFYYSPPSGYLALCTANLPETTISPNSATQADDYFNTVIWTGDGSSPRDITGVGFKPDWIWDKARNGSSNMSHVLYDSTRGVNQILSTDQTSAESTLATGTSAFLDDGFTVNAFSNASSQTRVAWNWKANGGTTSSNSEGTTTSTVQANTTAGFSIVTYAGNSSSRTVGHGLDSAPEWVIVKSRTDAERWAVFHTSISNGYIYLNDTFALQTGNADERFGDSSSVVVPSSTVVTLGANNSDVNENGDNYIMYCFHSVEGYSRFGSYTGNGSTDGTFVYLGFRPAFLLYKRTDSTGNWLIDDNKTQTFNPDSNYLLADSSDAEGDTTTNTAGHVFDMLSNGFKMRNTNSARNASGANYIYIAFASAPFKYANAR